MRRPDACPELEQIAINRLKEFEPPEGYYLADSGGKDSCVLRDLARRAGVRYDSHYNVTTIDPPELVRFIRRFHSDVIWERPEKPFLVRLVEKGIPPLRTRKWCCAEYKERGGSGRVVLLGIRAAESRRRSQRRMVEGCISDPSKRYVNPIIDWSERDVWLYIRKHELPYCELYDQGWRRIGCLFCPENYHKRRQREVRLYPRYEAAFRKAFSKLHQQRIVSNPDLLARWPDGDAYFDWWIGDGHIDETDQQIMQFHFDSDEDNA